MTENKKRELLQQYINGSITAKDRHALEREALDDVFLFEALEGYSKYMKSSDLPFYNMKPSTVLPIRTFMTMAASFLVLAAFAFSIKQHINPSINEQAISQMEENISSSGDVLVSSDNTEDTYVLEHHSIENNIENKSTFTAEKLKSDDSETRDLNNKKARQQPKITIKSSKNSSEASLIIEKQNLNNKAVTGEPEESVLASESIEASPSTENTRLNQVVDKTAKEQTATDQRILASKEKRSKTSIRKEIPIDTILENQESSIQYNNSADTNYIVHTSTKLNTKNAYQINQESIRIVDLPINRPLWDANNVGLASSDGAIFGIRYSPDNNIDNLDSLIGQNYRKIFPVDGWNHFNENLEKLKKQSNCSGMSFTYRYQILENGDMYDLQLTQLPPLDYSGKVLECLVKSKSFLEQYDKWETIPPNRKVNRKAVIRFDK